MACTGMLSISFQGPHLSPCCALRLISAGRSALRQRCGRAQVCHICGVQGTARRGGGHLEGLVGSQQVHQARSVELGLLSVDLRSTCPFQSLFL